MIQATDILVHYNEIAIKGRNRGVFEKHLITNIRKALTGLPLDYIQQSASRLWLRSKKGEFFPPETFKRLGRIAGISSFSPAIRTPLTMEAMKHAAYRLAEAEGEYDSFRISSRRAFKSQPFDSMSTNVEIGDHVFDHRQAKVKMKGADLDIRVEMVPDSAYVYSKKYPGFGGLPLGPTGRVAVLLSGGIDSPVAANRMQRRGCHCIFIHFHSHPLVSKASQEKAADLADVLVRYQHSGALYMVPFGELQREIITQTPKELAVVLYRRFMLRIAGAIAKREKAKALVTGEALGQVASQTLTNLVAIDQAAPIPVLRPLIGFDKHEIIAEAQRIGSYDISILPDQDCCTLFVPKHPETKADLETVLRLEESLSVDEMVREAVQNTERRHFASPEAHATAR